VILALFACAVAEQPGAVDVGATRQTFRGTLRAAWWVAAPGYGESPDDPIEMALLLDLDAPLRVNLAPARAGWTAKAPDFAFPTGPVLANALLYSASMGELTPDPEAASCLGKHVALTAALLPPTAVTAAAWATLADARIERCEPVAPSAPPREAALGPITLTGRVSARWAYVDPGFGTTPTTDRRLTYPTLELDRPLAVAGETVAWLPFTRAEGVGEETFRRTVLACRDQPVELAGQLDRAKDPRAGSPLVVRGVRFTTPCPTPALFRGVDRPPKPMPGWIEAATTP
jgi:hypothetical protein